MDGDGEYASLAMYPFVDVRADWERLWAAVASRVPWAPATLRWSGTVHEHWGDPSCTVAHACGYPLAAHLHDHAVVGAFSLRLPQADGHRYRSVLVAGADGDRLAANGDDSLSGWISAVAAVDVASKQVTFTGSHEASLAAIAAGAADMAMIDAVSLVHLRRVRPDLTTGLTEVGQGPWIPSPPIIVPSTTSSDRIDELRAAFSAALEDGSLGEPLLLDGFVPLERADYLPVLDLVGTPWPSSSP